MLSVVSSLLLVFGLLATCESQLTSLGTAGPTGPGAGVPGRGGHCTQAERQRAFERCLQNFGFQHYSHFDFLARNAPVCRAEVFRCKEMEEMMQCLNSQPTHVISNQCWIIMPEVMTSFWKEYSIPCTYNDLYNRCRGSNISDLKPVSQRSSMGSGMWNSMYTRLAPMISMMFYMGNNGMF